MAVRMKERRQREGEVEIAKIKRPSLRERGSRMLPKHGRTAWSHEHIPR